jgi:hypothetical protein
VGETRTEEIRTGNLKLVSQHMGRWAGQRGAHSGQRQHQTAGDLVVVQDYRRFGARAALEKTGLADRARCQARNPGVGPVAQWLIVPTRVSGRRLPNRAHKFSDIS